jgi:hypothetical protein
MIGLFLVNLFLIIIKVEGQLFCFVLCTRTDSCQSFAYDKCKGCAMGFRKATNTN